MVEKKRPQMVAFFIYLSDVCMVMGGDDGKTCEYAIAGGVSPC